MNGQWINGMYIVDYPNLLLPERAVPINPVKLKQCMDIMAKFTRENSHRIFCNGKQFNPSRNERK